jgi:amino acid transporter
MKNGQPQSIQKKSASKKISFFSVVLLVIGSTLGAGIFFKNNEILNNNHGSI